MDSAFLDIVRQAVPGATLELAPSRDMVTVFVERDYLVDVCRTLRDHADLQFALLADITAVVLLPASPRFHLGGIAGRHSNHRNPGWLVAASSSSGPGSGSPHELQQQHAANRIRTS